MQVKFPCQLVWNDLHCPVAQCGIRIEYAIKVGRKLHMMVKVLMEVRYCIFIGHNLEPYLADCQN
jgi:hypothetical protein